MHKTVWFLAAAFVLLVCAFAFHYGVLQTELSKSVFGTAPRATQLGAVNSMGIDVSNATPSDTSILNGGCDSDPFQALAKYGCTRQNECVPSGPGGQGGINSGLACRLVKLFDAAARAGCSPRINSAYRSAAKQASMCGGGRSGCAPAGKSCHQYGLAVDVSCADMLRRMAPQFQLHFPYWGPHIQCIEHKQASCNPSTPPCKGGGPIADPGQAGPQGQQQPQGGQPGGDPSGQGQPQSGQPQGGQPSGGQPGGDQGMPTGVSPSSQQDPFQKLDDKSGITETDLESGMTLTCDPETVVKGEGANIEWECPAGTRSVGSSSSSLAPLSTKGAETGSAIVKPQKKTKYTVQCKKGEIVVAKQSCEIALEAAQTKMSVRFSVEPLEVYPGETVEVEWTAQNVRSCAVTGVGIASADKSGRVTSGPIENEETFTIRCKPKTGTETFKKTETVKIIEEELFYDDPASSNNKKGQTTQVQTIFEDPLDEI